MARTTTTQDVPQDVPQETAQETAQEVPAQEVPAQAPAKAVRVSAWTETAIQTAISLAEKAAHYAKLREEHGIGALFVREDGKDICIIKPPIFKDEKGNEKPVKSSRVLEVFIGIAQDYRWLDGERLQVAIAASSLLADCWREWEQTVGKMQSAGKTFAEKANGLTSSASYMKARVEAVKESIPAHITY